MTRLTQMTNRLLLACSLGLPILVMAQTTKPSPAVSASPVQQAFMKAELNRLTDQFSDGLAAPFDGNPAVILYGQLFDDHQHDAVVFFNLEGFGGGNHHAEYMAVYAQREQMELAGKTAKPYQLIAVSKLGERGWRVFDFETARIEGRTISIKGKEAGPRDALCCASVPITRIFRIDEFDHVVETKTGPGKRETSTRKARAG
ncbi:hypothetical protein [Undibacterium sp. TS12]|uniref:hypothetical protein n=1 Tax=Undibacterium sp. TS12 TaxID=2908202 RepID=UPI001F4C52FF|nr:hypothetical protein [Undibacterium sp. TS12]MCH8619297.1 hypothetical protein [Undibacterium sp. TS12]